MRNYIARHWRGELSLPRSYWVNGVLILLPFNIYFHIAEEIARNDPPHTPLAYFYMFTLPCLSVFPLQVWAAVGIWRSAGFRMEAGRGGWATIARIVIVLNVLLLIWVGFVVSRYTYSAFQAEALENTHTYHIEQNNSFVVFHGFIGEKAGDELASALDRAGIKRLVINGSIGGFLRPAIEVANVVRKRHLMVTALAQCDSACTAILAAGSSRAIMPTTATGFHRGTIVGLDEATPEDKKIQQLYQDAGLGDEFITIVQRHSGPVDLYDPTLRDLIDAGFITEVFDLNAHAYVPAKLWCKDQPQLCAHTGRQNWIAKNGKAD